MDDLYADLDSIFGGEFSRRTKESIRLAVASVMARAEAAESKLKESEAEYARLKGLVAEIDRLKGLEAEIDRLRRALDDARAGKAPGGR